MTPVDAAATALATGLYLSYIPVKILQSLGHPRGKWTGAGFIGTLEGLALLPLLPASAAPFLAVVGAAIIAACWICGRAEIALGSHDDSRIVLDEVVGYWTTMALLPKTAPLLAAGFVLFRILDSVKLPPYRWLERLPGGIGVVADDVGAGLVANILLRVALKAFPGC